MPITYSPRKTIKFNYLVLECDCCGTKKLVHYKFYKKIKEKIEEVIGWRIRWKGKEAFLPDERIVYCPLCKLIN